ncbi:MAG: hypothetical protein EVA58_01840 [Kiritimatiellaceae bacterium]|nr:MAG: hypothetical protein EVA58_01840 [Kiritimatiellaceae bacterium]
MRFFLYSLVFFSCCASLAQFGGIRGQVIDSDFDISLKEVRLTVVESGAESKTDDNGAFFFEGLEPGSYTLIVFKPGYERVSKPNVVVSPDTLTELRFALAGEYEDMDELVVREIQLGGSSELGLLNLRMESSALMDSIGADLISKAGAGDAASALKLVAGATVQDGKYAVVRGLPDRYVISQINGIRLPSADPNKRAVQLDQFPSSVIESVQVAKSFTPDQQSDASGGAVDIVLKGIPNESVLAFKFGLKFNKNIESKVLQSSLVYPSSYFGQQAETILPQQNNTVWDSGVGVSSQSESVELLHSWGLTLGDKRNIWNDAELGFLFDFSYGTDASANVDVQDDSYWIPLRPDLNVGKFVPEGLSTDSNGSFNSDARTSLFDLQKSSFEKRWSSLGALGLEFDDQSFNIFYLRTHVQEEKATLAEDTRGKEFVYPGYDRFNEIYLTRQISQDSIADYRRSHTTEYLERDTETIQFTGKNKIGFDNVDLGKYLEFNSLNIDWSVSKNESKLLSPDKSIFSSRWNAGFSEIFDFGGGIVLDINEPSSFTEDKADGEATLGHVQRIWKSIIEESDQRSFDFKVPYKLRDISGGFKIGIFSDAVDRTFNQDTFSNLKGSNATGASWLNHDWTEYWNEVYPVQGLESENDIPAYRMKGALVDVDYTALQEIDAWYYNLDIPIFSWLEFSGGARFESTKMEAIYIAEQDVKWTAANGQLWSFITDPPPNNPIDQDDVLPALGFQLSPLDKIKIRGSYSETIARPTFREYSPIQQFEYFGGDLFIGDSSLTLSSLKNYDLRLDWAPYPGSLLSFSWFMKEIDKPIEHTQRYGNNVGVFNTAVNYPKGEMNGVEAEIRQSLGKYYRGLEGLSIGLNYTLINSEVTYSDFDYERLKESIAAINVSKPIKNTRELLHAPEFIYNANIQYDIEQLGLEAALFYSVKGESLLTGPNTYGNFVPGIYEKERGSLNFTLKHKMGRATWSVGIKNILNEAHETFYKSDYLDEMRTKLYYESGISYSLGCNIKF